MPYPMEPKTAEAIEMAYYNRKFKEIFMSAARSLMAKPEVNIPPSEYRRGRDYLDRVDPPKRFKWVYGNTEERF